MSLRRIPLLFVVFLLGAIFGKPLALGSLGLFVKTALYFDKGWSFHYHAVDWQSGKLLFSSIELKEEKSFFLQSSQMSLDWRKKHLELESPKLLVSAIPSSHQSSDWTLSMKDGVLEGAGFQKARFSFEKTLPDQVGHLVLEWDQSGLTLDAIRQGKELMLEAELQHFETSLFERHPFCRGVIDGNLHLVFEAGLWKRGSAHLSVEKFGYRDFVSNLDGTIDWDGDAIDFSCLSLANGKKICDSSEERLHFVIANGLLNSPLGDIQGLKGNLSFLSGLGAKWELRGEDGSGELLVWQGRSFFPAQKAHWIESDLQWRDAFFSLKGNEEKEGVLWDIACKNMSSFQVGKLYPYLVALEPKAAGWELCKGFLSGSGEVFVLQDAVHHWEASLSAENILCAHSQVQIECGTMGGSFSSQNKKGQFSFEEAFFRFSLWFDQNIEGKKWTGRGQIENGMLIDSLIQGECEGIAASIRATGSLERFCIEAKTDRGSFLLTGAPQKEHLDILIEKGEIDQCCFSGKGLLYHDEASLINGFCQIRGQWKCGPNQSLPFYCPVLEKKGKNVVFDVRLEGASWDWMRLYGELKENGEISFDSKRSHLLGEPADISLCKWDSKGLEKFSMQVPLHRNALLLGASFFKKEIEFWMGLPFEGGAFLSFQYEREGISLLKGKGKDLCWRKQPIDFDFLAQGQQGNWDILLCQMEDFSLRGKMKKEKDFFHIYDGKVDWKQKLNTEFEGNLNAISLQSEFHLSHLFLELGALHSFTSSLSLPFRGIEGLLEGSGCVTWKESFQADFDCRASQLKMGSFEWENQGPLHFYYSPAGGISLSGLDFHSPKYQGIEFPDFNCKMDLLAFDPKARLWLLHGAHIYGPCSLIQKIPQVPIFSQALSSDQNIDFLTDCSIASDFSHLMCSMKEGFIPLGGSIRHLQNLTLDFSKEGFWAQFQYSHQGYPLQFHLDVDLDPTISGKLMIESSAIALEEDQLPLTMYWTHNEKEGFSLKEIQGAFPGIEASFHKAGEDPYLIGSARFDCPLFSKVVPPDIAELFSDLKMGKGYELKGRLFTHAGWPSFSGLLSGKQFDLFGYQLRTLLGHIELSSERVRVFDLKISDSAAMLKTEEILAESKEGAPWTISIPHITILELRPSLLRKNGGEPGLLSPLVVRELHIDEFKGLLDDSKTYTAQGNLEFINSYRREYTLFDIPADLLSRIVGLDLALLIPACGQLSYELREGKFYLKELTGAYSEGKRSEFSLVPVDPIPTMDLDGKLQILVKCNQFVLFKFMESFMISIEGELNDPKFHLQKKRRFWGL